MRRTRERRTASAPSGAAADGDATALTGAGSRRLLWIVLVVALLVVAAVAWFTSRRLAASTSSRISSRSMISSLPSN
jgi:hypothetical protein